MKSLILVSAVGGLILVAGSAPAQKLANVGSGGFGLASAYAKTWNPSTVITFRGKVTGVTVASPINGTANSVRLVVRSLNSGSSLVELGPQWYVDRQNVTFKPKDNVTITGSKIILDGRGSIMASKIVVGRKMLILRDSRGNPFWAADSPAFAPVLARDTPPQTSGSATQPIAITPATPVAKVPVVPLKATQPVFMAPATINGVIDHFNIENGEVFMVVSVGSNAQTVYLGPEWYIQRQDLVLNPGDLITALILAPLGGGDFAYAQWVTSGATTLYLRNNTGQMVWSPWYVVPTIR